jgi:hypothetical protein
VLLQFLCPLDSATESRREHSDAREALIMGLQISLQSSLSHTSTVPVTEQHGKKRTPQATTSTSIYALSQTGKHKAANVDRSTFASGSVSISTSATIFSSGRSRKLGQRHGWWKVLLVVVAKKPVSFGKGPLP